MSKLLTNGCSLTWGSGLNPDTRVVDAYPYKLAKLLDVELIDLSKPGESCLKPVASFSKPGVLKPSASCFDATSVFEVFVCVLIWF